MDKIYECYNNKYELFLIFFNIFFFMIIQTLFFKYVISKEYDIILEEKFNSIKFFVSNDEELMKDFILFKDNYLKKNSELAKTQSDKRNKENNSLYMKHSITPIIVIIIIIIIILLSKIKGVWEYSTTINFLLVFLIYLPEFLIFIFVIKKYQHIGNLNIINKIYKELI